MSDGLATRRQSRFFIAALTVGSLAACSSVSQDQVAREAARATLTPMVEARFPGVPVAPAVDCVIDNANGQEILTLASASVTGVTAETTQVAAEVLSRPETVNCVANEGLNLLIAGGL